MPAARHSALATAGTSCRLVGSRGNCARDTETAVPAVDASLNTHRFDLADASGRRLDHIDGNCWLSRAIEKAVIEHGIDIRLELQTRESIKHRLNKIPEGMSVYRLCDARAALLQVLSRRWSPLIAQALRHLEPSSTASAK